MRLNISKKLYAGYLVLLTLMVLVGAVAIINFILLNQITRSVLNEEFPTIQSAAKLRDALLAQIRNEKQFVVLGDPDFVKSFNQANEQFEDILMEMGHAVRAKELSNTLGQVKMLHADYVKNFRDRVPATGVKPDPDLQRDESSRRLFEQQTHLLDALSTGAQLNLRDKMDRSNRLEGLAENMTLAIVLIAAVGGGVTAFVVIRGITRPIDRLKTATQSVASGQYDLPIVIRTQDEIGDLSKSFNQMTLRLKEADRLKEEFIAYVSHELKTPLTSLKEAGSLLLDQVPGPINAKQTKLLEIIAGDCEKISALVRDLLDLSRMEAGMLLLDRAPVHMEEIARDALEEVHPLALKHKLTIRFDTHAPTPALPLDKRRIHQVLTNLLMNAIRFTPPNGTIRVSIENSSQPPELQVRVSDTGIGIPKEKTGMVFDKFQQIGPPRGSTPRGTGLGLPIAKHIVEAHGGIIRLDSELGKGSTFTIAFPVAQTVESA